MRAIEQLHLEAILAGETVTVDRLEYARELSRVATLHSGQAATVEYSHADRPGEYRVRLYDTPSTGPTDPGPFPSRRPRRRPLHWAEEARAKITVPSVRPTPFPQTFDEWNAMHLALPAPGEPPVETRRHADSSYESGAPCADCTQESAVYRAIPVDEVTLEYLFLKSRKFLGGATLDELEELLQEALAENEGLDYAEVFWVRERHKFEAGAGNRLRSRRQS